MAVRRNCLGFLGMAVVASIAGSSCVALHNAGVPGFERFAKPDPAVFEKQNSQRELFSLHRDHKAFYWMLANRVSNGMPLREVEEVFGESGEYTTEFSQLKADGLYQTTDSAYKWGPDSAGRSAVLFFRDGRVINFNPSDFRNP